MTIRQRFTAALAAIALATVGLLTVAAPAQASPDGCHELSPWTAYPASWSPVVMTTNRFIAQGCGVHTITDIDLIYIRDSHNVSQCAYFRVELFYSDGRSAGAFTDQGPWTWKLICDGTYPRTLLDAVPVGTKYDVQQTPMSGEPVQSLWLGDMLD
jgi:hypothetical protein